MLQAQLEEDFKTAFKSKNEVAVAALRNAKAAIQNAQLTKPSLTDEEVLAVLAKKVKQHKDSIMEFERANRQDLADVEKAQMAVLEKYLPKQMADAEVRNLVQTVIAELAAKPSDFGKVMKEALSRARGQTDGTVVSKIVKEELK